MFLVEFKAGHFVNGEKINWLNITKKKVKFTLECDDPESFFEVEPQLAGTFLNNLQAINGNLTSVEAFYSELNKEAA